MPLEAHESLRAWAGGGGGDRDSSSRQHRLCPECGRGCARRGFPHHLRLEGAARAGGSASTAPGIPYQVEIV